MLLSLSSQSFPQSIHLRLAIQELRPCFHLRIAVASHRAPEREFCQEGLFLLARFVAPPLDLSGTLPALCRELRTQNVFDFVYSDARLPGVGWLYKREPEFREIAVLCLFVEDAALIIAMKVYLDGRSDRTLPTTDRWKCEAIRQFDEFIQNHLSSPPL